MIDGLVVQGMGRSGGFGRIVQNIWLRVRVYLSAARQRLPRASRLLASGLAARGPPACSPAAFLLLSRSRAAWSRSRCRLFVRGLPAPPARGPLDPRPFSARRVPPPLDLRLLSQLARVPQLPAPPPPPARSRSAVSRLPFGPYLGPRRGLGLALGPPRSNRSRSAASPRAAAPFVAHALELRLGLSLSRSTPVIMVSSSRTVSLKMRTSSSTQTFAVRRALVLEPPRLMR